MFSSFYHGALAIGWAGYGSPKIMVGWATVHLAPPIIGLYSRLYSLILRKKIVKLMPPDVTF